MIVQKSYPSFLVKGTTPHCQFLSPKRTQQESWTPKPSPMSSSALASCHFYRKRTPAYTAVYHLWDNDWFVFFLLLLLGFKWQSCCSSNTSRKGCRRIESRMKGSSHLGFQKSKALKGTMSQGDSQVVQIQKFLPKLQKNGSSKEDQQTKRFQLVEIEICACQIYNSLSLC